MKKLMTLIMAATLMGCYGTNDLHGDPTECEINCDDGDPCTMDVCDVEENCFHVPLSGCVECYDDSDCMDEDPCTIGTCESGSCVQSASDDPVCNPACESHADCNDGDPCTEDVCDFDGECTHSPMERIIIVADEDGDGYGGMDSGSTSLHCPATEMPPGYVTNADDCDDEDPEVHPGVTEICDGVDNNCDGVVDESDPHAGEFCWAMMCDGPDCVPTPAPGLLECRESYYETSLQCERNCASSETCDGVDNNCDGVVDEGCECAACGGCVLTVTSLEGPPVAFSDGEDMHLLRFQLEAHQDLRIDRLMLSIGADCNGDHALAYAADSGGGFYEDGGYCRDASHPLEGLLNEETGDHLIEDIRIVDEETMTTLMGPSLLTSFPMVDDGMANMLHLHDQFYMSAGETRILSLKADVSTESMLMASVYGPSIAGDFPSECVAVDQILVGMPRTPTP